MGTRKNCLTQSERKRDNMLVGKPFTFVTHSYPAKEERKLSLQTFRGRGRQAKWDDKHDNAPLRASPLG